MPLGLLIFALLSGIGAAAVAVALCDACFCIAVTGLLVTANLVAGLGGLWIARRRR